MKRVTTSTLCLSALAFALSCSKSKEINQVDPPDLTPIGLTVTGIKSNDTLRNTLTAEIKAEHSSGIKSIEVFANDELVASAAADSLSLSLNTLDLPDGTYNLKVVVSDEAGNKKEQAASVIVSNALVKIDRDLLVGGDASAYFITDSIGQIVGRANFVNDGTHNNIVSIYPSEAFNGNKINLTRVSTSADLLPKIEYFVEIKRGAHLSAKNLEAGKGRLNEYQEAIPITVKNMPEYDHMLVSTNTLYYQFPVSPDYDYSLPYTSGSKSLLLIEQNGTGRYGLFDIPAGSAKVELDAAQANLIPSKQTIQVPAGATDASITVYGQVSRGYDEFYTFANKKFPVIPLIFSIQKIWWKT
ncbi:Ig-like domain-containing protein [Parapedobacter lycopersici]|uniref:Ig-like domain-containing protein n=1 Tax=Parapedobacter lycopersici TaxID=1864939 RepID=UPI00214DA9D3|nr:Ig-like domain-containing protein [Parapedobacter lycopersici]